MNYLGEEVSTHLQAKLDKNQYDESRLIRIKVPLNMPYIADWNDFETFEGETEINGIHYRYVKRKIENGELVLLCIPNEQKTSLQAAEQHFFKLVNDIQQPGAKKDSKEHSAKIPMSDYINNTLASINAVTRSIVKDYSDYKWFIPPVYISTRTQRPEC